MGEQSRTCGVTDADPNVVGLKRNVVSTRLGREKRCDCPHPAIQAVADGKQSVKVVAPARLSTSTRPRCSSMIDFTIARPRPMFFADPCLAASMR